MSALEEDAVPGTSDHTRTMRSSCPASAKNRNAASLRPAAVERAVDSSQVRWRNEGSSFTVRERLSRPQPWLLSGHARPGSGVAPRMRRALTIAAEGIAPLRRSEEHTSELQSRRDLVCRLLLEKKKKKKQKDNTYNKKE